MRIMAVDYGRAKIGLALSDPTGTIASPIGCLTNKGSKKNLAAFDALIKIHNPSKIIMGLPLHTDGSESAMSAEVKQFGELLHKELSMEVIYFDERYTSKMAEEEIREKMGIKNPKKIVEIVDTVAASMLLMEYINKGRKDK